MMKEIVGVVESLEISGEKTVSCRAVIDTGAMRTSIDLALASRVGLGPVTGVTGVRNPSLKQQVSRPLVRAKIRMKERLFEIEVNLQDRSHMNFPVIIGRDILAGNFLVDPEKNADLFKKRAKEHD